MKIALSMVLVGGAVAYLLSQSFGDAMVYSKYVDELMVAQDRYAGRQLRVEGLVEEGSFEGRPGSLDYRFRLAKGGHTLDVSYHGSEIPDTFAEGRGVVVQGKLRGRGHFVADRIIAKCPSKYEMQARQQGGAGLPHPSMPALPGGPAVPAVGTATP